MRSISNRHRTRICPNTSQCARVMQQRAAVFLHRRWLCLVVAEEAGVHASVRAAQDVSVRLLVLRRMEDSRIPYMKAVSPSGLNAIPLQRSNPSATTRTEPVSGSNLYTWFGSSGRGRKWFRNPYLDGRHGQSAQYLSCVRYARHICEEQLMRLWVDLYVV